MKRRALVWAVGTVLVATALFSLLVPKRRTPFEEGYGLRFTDEKNQTYLGRTTTQRTFASQESFAITEALISHSVGSGPETTMRGFRIWAVPEGSVSIADRTAVVNDEDWPKGATCVVSTYQPCPSMLQRVARLVGIRL